MPGRHRAQANIRIAISVVAAVTLGVAIGGWAVSSQLGADCDRRTELGIAAAPDIAPALRSAVDAWTAEDDRCVTVDIAAVEPIDVAAAVADRHAANLIGLGRPNGTTRAPDVWVPDSSMWQLRLQATAPGFRPAEATSIARSPVVLAVPQPVATPFGWPDAAFTWAALLREFRTGSTVKAGIVDPARDAAGLSSLLAMGTAAGSGPDAVAANVAALHKLAEGRSALRTDLLARFPRAQDPAALAGSLTIAPVAEQAVVEYNRARPSVGLAALYVEPAPLALDYPYIVMPGTDPIKAEAAGVLRAALASDGFRDTLARYGLRGPDGIAGAGFDAPRSAPAAAGGPAAGGAARALAAGFDLALVERTLGAWLALTRPGRILAVMDVSSAMLTKVPTAGNRTRAQVTVEAARQGLVLFDDSWAVGLWEFSTNLADNRDYRQLLPIAPLSATRARTSAALDTIRPRPDGRTGLYDTLLAAYKEVQRDWDPGRMNAVVILTHGGNEDAVGLNLDGLLAGLDQAKDRDRPVDVVAIGIGPDVASGPLQRVVDITGGGVFVAPDPAQIGDIFLRALALHTRSQ